MARTLEEIKAIQEGLIGEGVLKKENARSPELLSMKKVMDSKEGSENFYIIGKLTDRTGTILQLAVQADSNNVDPVVVVKILSDEEMQSTVETAMSALGAHKVSDLNVYQPVVYSAGFGKWAGLEEAKAVVYPYVRGIPLDNYFEKIQGDPEALKKIVKVTANLCELAQSLLKRNVPGIWDFKDGNVIVKSDCRVVFIDYEFMRYSFTADDIVTALKDGFAKIRQAVPAELSAILDSKYESFEILSNRLRETFPLILSSPASSIVAPVPELKAKATASSSSSSSRDAGISPHISAPVQMTHSKVFRSAPAPTPAPTPATVIPKPKDNKSG